MPHVTGPITEHGAIVGVLLGVSRRRQPVLERNHLVVPKMIPLRVQVDTGSSYTGFVSAAFAQLEIPPVGTRKIRTPSTTPGQPHTCPVFDVVLHLVAGTDLLPVPLRVIACEDFDRNPWGDVHGIVGRDALSYCTLMYLGREQRFELGF